MNKIALSALIFASSVIAFAQENRVRPTREDQFNQFNLPPGGGPEENDFGGEFPAPIDNYEFFLLGIAVLLIVYFLYKRKQTA